MGARRDPLIGLAINKAVDAVPGVSQEQLDMLELSLARPGANLEDVFKVVGQWGPALWGASKAFQVGRSLMVGATSLLGRRFTPAAVTGTEEFLRQTAGRGLRNQLARTAGRASQTGGEVFPVPKPLIEKASEIVGGTVGVGTFAGAEEAASGSPLRDVGQTALIAAGLTAGFEGALLGFKVFKGAREVDPLRIVDAFRKSAGVREEFKKSSTKHLRELGRQMDDILKSADQEAQLAVARAARPSPQAAFEQSERALRRFEEVRRQAFQVGQQKRSFTALMGGPETFSRYLRESPLNPSGEVRRYLSEAGAKIGKSPEALGRELGPTMTRVVQSASQAELEVSLGRAASEIVVKNWRRQIARALGQSEGIREKKKKAFSQAALQLFDAFEKGGSEGVSQFLLSRGRSPKDVQRALDVFNQIRQTRGLYDQLVRMGAEPALEGAELARLGLREFIPHVLAPLSKGQLRSRIIDSLLKDPNLGMSEAAAAAQADRMLRGVRQGLRRFGSIDHQRAGSGSLLDKVEQGMPFIDDPFEGLAQYMTAVHRRFAYGKRFGFNGELKKQFLLQAEREGASRALANTALDAFLRVDYYDGGLSSLARTLTSLQIASKLAFSVIPNASQSANTLIANGFRNTFRGFLDGTSQIARTKARRDRLILHTLGTTDGLWEAMRNSIVTSPRTRSERLAMRLLRATGFTAVERFNRGLGAMAGKQTILRTLYKAARGDIRGRHLDVARRQMGELGINLDQFVRGARPIVQRNPRIRMNQFEDLIDDVLGKSEIRGGVPIRFGALERAMEAATRQTQFLPDATRRPLWWRTPEGRIITQFKTFAFNQGRFIRDAVLNEAGRGNLGPLARMASVYPVAGEAVATTTDLARLRNRREEGFDRLMDDIFAVGGLGIASDAIRASQFGRGALLELAAGPTVTDAFTIATAILSANPSGVARAVERQPVIQLGRSVALGGAVATVLMSDWVATLDDEEPEENEGEAEAPRLRDLQGRF